jgi:hypothetical protein
VFLKVKIPAETFTTDWASEGFLLIVGMHVKGQVINLVKSLITDITFVLFFCTMSQFMVFVITFLMEAFSAVFTCKRFITRVNSHMSIQG